MGKSSQGSLIDGSYPALEDVSWPENDFLIPEIIEKFFDSDGLNLLTLVSLVPIKGRRSPRVKVSDDRRYDKSLKNAKLLAE